MQVVARLLDKGKIKGETTDFHPERETFTIHQDDGAPIQVAVGDLKALFFVRSLDGNPTHRDHRRFKAQNGGVRAKLWLEFEDGEKMAAYPVSPMLGPVGFYVLPTDPNSNIEKAWVYRPSLKRVLEGPEAEQASKRFRSGDGRYPSSEAWPRQVPLG